MGSARVLIAVFIMLSLSWAAIKSYSTRTDRGGALLDIQDFSRRTFEVKGVQVTRENIEEVAEWCDGTIAEKLEDAGDIYIVVPVKQPPHKKAYPSRAYLNYWVLKSGTGFRVYSPTGFEVAFTEKTAVN